MDKADVEKLRKLLTDQTKERLVLEILLLCSGNKEVEADFKKRYFPPPPKPCILSDEQVNTIAEGVEMSNVYYINLDTREIEEMFNDEHLSFYGISMDDDDENENDDDDDNGDDEVEGDDGVNADEPDRNLPDWQIEMENGIREQIKKVKSWQNAVVIKAPDSHTAYSFMQLFVTRVIPQKKQGYFEDILNGRKPFAKFNQVIHNSPYREDWFAFKRQMMIQYVKDCLDDATDDADEEVGRE